jgi:uncharacterized protein (TIGR01777 family)
MSNKGILITGGSGLIGKALTEALLKKGYKVSHLSRNPGHDPRIETYIWNVEKNIVDGSCLDGISTVIHLAGTGIADKRWTDKRKKLLIESRTKSIRLVYELIKKIPNQVKTIISASAIGYYSDRGDELLYEESKPGDDFLANCCIEWEKAVDEGDALGLKITKLRTGVMLTKEGGALPQIALPVKLGLGATFGSGKQWIPWIHWQDVVNIYLFALENDLPGTFNMVAPTPVTNKELTKAIAEQLKRPIWLPNVPGFMLKLIFGELSILILGSINVSAEKIIKEGFNFEYPDLKAALKEIYA